MTIVRWIFALLIIAAVGMAAMSGLKPRATPPTRVNTAKAAKMTLTHTVSAAGKLEPLHKVNVSSNITGTLIDLQVGIGSKVTKGQYLGQIDTSRYADQVKAQKAQLAAAHADVRREKANLAKLRSEADRLEKLAARGGAGASDVEQAQAAVRVAEANLAASESRAQMAAAGLAEAKKTFDWATLRAPVDGTVLAVNHRVGERIRGSDFTEDVVLVLGSVDAMEVRVEVGEHDVVHITPGQKATIEIDALPNRVVNGHVIDSGRDAIVKNAGTDAEVTTFPVWIALDDAPPNALSGMSAQVTISTETRESVVAVPIQAVTVRAPEATETGAAAAPARGSRLEKVVFVVRDGKVEQRRVVPGLSSDTHLEISEGLADGEEVVEGPYRTLARTLRNGDVIAVDNDAPGAQGRR